MSMEKLREEIKHTNELVTELIIVTKQTRKTLTMVNIINTITLIVIGILAVRGIV